MAWGSGELAFKLIGAVARSTEGTNTGHENAKGMACAGIRVERSVREPLHNLKPRNSKPYKSMTYKDAFGDFRGYTDHS